MAFEGLPPVGFFIIKEGHLRQWPDYLKGCPADHHGCTMQVMGGLRRFKLSPVWYSESQTLVAQCDAGHGCYAGKLEGVSWLKVPDFGRTGADFRVLIQVIDQVHHGIVHQQRVVIEKIQVASARVFQAAVVATSKTQVDLTPEDGVCWKGLLK